jgi:acyl-CoA thioesterase-1
MVFALTCLTVIASALMSSLVFAQKTAAPSSQSNTSVPSILILGDSLSAEYGLARGTGWVALLEKKLQSDQSSWKVVNASISGETTAGGQTRLAQLLKVHQPKVVVIELGANDALRGLQLKATEKNLQSMIQASKNIGAKVLVLGMRIPPNYGQEYTTQFFNLFGKLAQSENVAYVPFFLEGVALKMELFQADRIHPNEKAQPVLLGNVLPKLLPLLRP